MASRSSSVHRLRRALGEIVGPGLGVGLEGLLDDARSATISRCRAMIFLISLMGEIEGIEDDRFGQLGCAALDHGDGILGAGDHEIELALLELLEGREEDELAIDAADANARDGVVERDVLGGHQQASDAPVMPRMSELKILVGGHHPGDDLGLAVIAVRERAAGDRDRSPGRSGSRARSDGLRV